MAKPSAGQLTGIPRLAGSVVDNVWNFAVAFPRKFQIDMTTVDEKGILKTAPFLFLDHLLNGIMLKFQLLQTVDRAARRFVTDA